MDAIRIGAAAAVHGVEEAARRGLDQQRRVHGAFGSWQEDDGDVHATSRRQPLELAERRVEVLGLRADRVHFQVLILAQVDQLGRADRWDAQWTLAAKVQHWRHHGDWQ